MTGSARGCCALRILCCPHLGVLGVHTVPSGYTPLPVKQAADTDQVTCALQASGRQACLLLLSAVALRLGRQQWTT